jgi:hypothetical protein
MHHEDRKSQDLFCSVLCGPRSPQFQFLFLLQVLPMWAPPWIFLSAPGRHGIGLCKPRKWLLALTLSGIGGDIAGLPCFALGWATPHEFAQHLLVSVHDGSAAGADGCARRTRNSLELRRFQ